MRTWPLQARASLVSLLILVVLGLAWHIGVNTGGTGGPANVDPEYAKLLGVAANTGKSAMPGPLDVLSKIGQHLKEPFYDRGPNDKGIGIQLAYSIGRVLLGYGIAVLVAIPLGFLIGMSPLMSRALDPFIQIMKPVSPLAWMPLALYTIKDSAISSIFVIFICSLWPMLVNTAFGVSSVRKEWLNVALSCRPLPLQSSPACVSPSALPGWSSWRPRCSWAEPASATSSGTSGTTSLSLM
jgi:nitrate/nitrite transport system permease protein